MTVHTLGFHHANARAGQLSNAAISTRVAPS